jgi:DNA-binding HxlR family transcriptional regulator
LLEGEYLAAVYADPNHKACPITETFRIVGKSGTVVILRELFMGANRFNQIKRGVGRINPKVLSNRLKELEGSGVVTRKVTPGRPVMIEYSLTEKGRNLFPLIFAAAKYSMANCPGEVFRDGIAYTPEEVFGRVSH